MVGLVKAVYDFVGWISNPSDHNFNKGLHRFLKEVAYSTAQNHQFKEHQDIYWDIAKARVALEILTDRNVHPSRSLSQGYFTPPKEEMPLCQRDAEVIAKGLRFEGCYDSAGIPFSVRDAINQEIQILRDNWYGKRKGKKAKPSKKKPSSRAQ